MIPEIKVATNPLEFYKCFMELPKPPANHKRPGKELSEHINLSYYIADDLSLGKYFTVTHVEREPTLNRVSVCFNTTDGIYTDHAARLDNKRDIKMISNGRPLIVEVVREVYGNSLQMTPATVQLAVEAIYVIYNGCIYRADKAANINLLYAIYSEFYFLKFGGLKTEDGEFRQSVTGSRLAFFYKPDYFDKLMTKYGIRDGIC